MAKDTFTGPLERVDACCSRIPKSYKQGMLVDGLIFSSEKLMEQLKKDQAPEQVANVAFLPGIQQASLAMPDIHWGYGSCIGGVCATDPDEGGVISPGGVGYDINCFDANTEIISSYGYTQRIGEMSQAWRTASLACYNLEQSHPDSTEVCHWFGQKPRVAVRCLRTEGGDEVRATGDHPFWTPEGMVPLEQLQAGDRVAVSPFRGVPYEAPSDEVLVSKEDFTARWAAHNKGAGGNGLAQTVKFLEERGLLPLRYSSPSLPELCKILAFVMGDGNIHFVARSGKGVVAFYGPGEELERIRADLQRIGFTPSRVYSRARHHAIPTPYRVVVFDRQEDWFFVRRIWFGAAARLSRGPRGQQGTARLRGTCLAGESALVAEASVPRGPVRCGTLETANADRAWDRFLHADPEHEQAHVQGGKRPALPAAARGLVAGLRCGDPGHHRATRTTQPGWRAFRSPASPTVGKGAEPDQPLEQGRVRIQPQANRPGGPGRPIPEGQERKLGERQKIVVAAHAFVGAGVAASEVIGRLASDTISQNFVAGALRSGPGMIPRVPKGYPTFAEFCEQAAVGSLSSGMVWERIERIEPVPDFEGDVYDFTVAHPDHNFIANGFVVSNCGVRLVRSNLYYQDVKPRLRSWSSRCSATCRPGPAAPANTTSAIRN